MELLANTPKEKRPYRYEILVAVWEKVITFMVYNSFKTADMYTDACQLIHCWVDMVYILLETDVYPGVFEDINRLKTIIDLFIFGAPAASHLYSLCDILYDKVSE